MYFILMGSFIFWRDKATAEQKLHHEIQRSESLLVNILPVPVAEQLKQGERSIAKYYEHVTVLFADLVGFTRIATAVSPQQLLSMLDTIFSRFDVIVQKHGVEKIKTIGDAYMLVGGIPEQQPNHAEAVARVALEMQECLSSLPPSFPIGLSVRIGIHTGEVIAGVIGHTKFSYDLWGDTVNTASRMESHGEPGKIHCSDAIYHLLKDQFHFEPCGLTEIKGKGMMQTWFLVEEQRP
jgi:class 3 adenylate cyclase